MSTVAGGGSSARVEPALAPPPGSPRFDRLDALRGAAACSVIFIHLTAFSGMDTSSPVFVLLNRLSACVAVFFLLSGFLLYRPFVAGAQGRGRRPSLARYARGRVLRIVPAYWVALTFAAVVWPGVPGVLTHDWWRYYLLVQGYDARLTLGGLPPAWTLSVEVAFYVALPLVVIAIAHRRPRTQLIALGVVSVLSIALRTTLSARGESLVVLQTLPGLTAWFAAGMGLAVISVARDGRPVGWLERHPWLPWIGAGLAYAGICFVHLPASHAAGDYTASETLAEHVAYLLMAIGLALPPILGTGDRGPRRLLSSRLLTWMGVVSYGTYLWHWPLLGGLRDAGLHGWLELGTVGVLASYAVGALSWYLLERPVLRLKDPSRLRPGRRRRPAPAARQASP